MNGIKKIISNYLVLLCFFSLEVTHAEQLRTAREIMRNVPPNKTIHLENGIIARGYEAKSLSSRSFFGIPRYVSGGFVGENVKLNGTKSGNKILIRDAFIGSEAQIFENAQIYGKARLSGRAKVYGNAEIFDYAKVAGDARVFGHAKVYGYSAIHGSAKIHGHAKVYDRAWVNDSAEVFGRALIFDNALVSQRASVSGNSQIFGSSHIYGNININGDTFVGGNDDVYHAYQLTNRSDRVISTNIDNHCDLDDIGSEYHLLNAEDLSCQEECPICFQDFEDDENIVIWKLKNCSHIYHKHCIAKWYARGKNTCPNCRATLN